MSAAQCYPTSSLTRLLDPTEESSGDLFSAPGSLDSPSASMEPCIKKKKEHLTHVSSLSHHDPYSICSPTNVLFSQIYWILHTSDSFPLSFSGLLLSPEDVIGVRTSVSPRAPFVGVTMPGREVDPGLKLEWWR
jgi:hypothetical protein